MSTNPAQRSFSSPNAKVHSFLEDSCYDKQDQLRGHLSPVVFRLFSVGASLGPRVDTTFVANYGIYYDGDDNPLIQALMQAVPHVHWSHGKIFHRIHEKPRIDILNAETGRVVARVETRRYYGRPVTPEAVAEGRHGANVKFFSKPELSSDTPE